MKHAVKNLKSMTTCAGKNLEIEKTSKTEFFTKPFLSSPVSPTLLPLPGDLLANQKLKKLILQKCEKELQYCSQHMDIIDRNVIAEASKTVHILSLLLYI
jgi:hypothetical protein